MCHYIVRSTILRFLKYYMQWILQEKWLFFFKYENFPIFFSGKAWKITFKKILIFDIIPLIALLWPAEKNLYCSLALESHVHYTILLALSFI